MAHTYRNPLRIRNLGGGPMVVVIEPWANEWELASGEEGEVVATHPSRFPRLSLEMLEGRAVFYVEDEGSLYEFWMGGVQVG